MRIDLLTLFPDMCEAVMAESIVGRARKKDICRYAATRSGILPLTNTSEWTTAPLAAARECC